MFNRLFVLAALLGVPAASLAKCPVPATTSPASTVVASVDGASITLGEVDAHADDMLCAARIEYRQKLDTVRQGALDDMIDTRLLEAEAKRRKTTVPELLAAEVAKAGAPDEATQRAFYERFKDRINQPFETVQAEIVQVLTQQAGEMAHAKLISTLRAAAKVSTDLPPLRLPVEAKGFGKGPEAAPITVVMFADYECPYCSRGFHNLEAAAKKFPGKVRMVFRDYPLAFHQNAVPAAIAARCAGAQGKFEAMHDTLYAHQDALDEASLKSYAAEIKLDMKAYAACVAKPEHQAAVEADMAAGGAVGVDGTPAFFINGIKLGGAQPPEAFEAIFTRELARGTTGTSPK